MPVFAPPHTSSPNHPARTAHPRLNQTRWKDLSQHHKRGIPSTPLRPTRCSSTTKEDFLFLSLTSEAQISLVLQAFVLGGDPSHPHSPNPLPPRPLLLLLLLRRARSTSQGLERHFGGVFLLRTGRSVDAGKVAGRQAPTNRRECTWGDVAELYSLCNSLSSPRTKRECASKKV